MEEHTSPMTHLAMEELRCLVVTAAMVERVRFGGNRETFFFFFTDLISMIGFVLVPFASFSATLQEQ